MTAFPSSPAPGGRDEFESSGRCTLSLLMGFGLLWLLVSGALLLLNLAQLNEPRLLADCPLFTFGRVHALQETAFVYGWAANAGLALLLWILGRLGGAPLRGLTYATIGTLFWNLGLLAGLAGIATGDATSFSLFQLPGYVQPLMWAALAAVSVPGILAWTGRRPGLTYAAQWYAMAALLILPWIFSAAHVLLHQMPVRGVLQAIVAAWYAQNLAGLWLASIALSVLYFLYPKLSGRVLPHYDFAIYGFWSLLLFGSWTGGRHLINGPVPAWIPSVATACSVLLLFHYIIVGINLRGLLRPGGSTTLRFLSFGLLAYLLAGVADLAVSFRSVATVTQFTYFQQAQTQLVFGGAFTMIAFGAFYWLLPRLTGSAWPSVALIRAHYAAMVVGFCVLIISLAVAGWIQGHDLNTPAVGFATLTAHSRPWLQVATTAQALLLAGNLLFAFHVFQIMKVKYQEAAAS